MVQQTNKTNRYIFFPIASLNSTFENSVVSLPRLREEDTTKDQLKAYDRLT